MGDSVDVEDLCEHLIAKLESIQTGTTAASEYHKLTFGILELLFYPDLICPQIEEKIHEGLKRIDIVFDNAAGKQFFFNLHNSKGIPCQFVFIECKNYNSDPANPELDQIAGRFAPNRGKFGIICCRKISDFQLFMKRCADTYRDDRG